MQKGASHPILLEGTRCIIEFVTRLNRGRGSQGHNGAKNTVYSLKHAGTFYCVHRNALKCFSSIHLFRRVLKKKGDSWEPESGDEVYLSRRYPTGDIDARNFPDGVSIRWGRAGRLVLGNRRYEGFHIENSDVMLQGAPGLGKTGVSANGTTIQNSYRSAYI